MPAAPFLPQTSNVDPDNTAKSKRKSYISAAMIIELRIYTTIPGRMPNLLARFENNTIKIWERHGIKQVGFFTTLVGPNSNDLTYMLQWDSLAEREKKWAAFLADEQWIKARAESESDGPINQNVYSSFLMPTAFSALK
jgi:hypothetical protein